MASPFAIKTALYGHYDSFRLPGLNETQRWMAVVAFHVGGNVIVVHVV